MSRLFVFVLAVLAGCATYTDDVREVQQDFAAGRIDSAIGRIDGMLGVSTPKALPPDLAGDRVLLLLERAALLQAAGDYERSARDLAAADERLVWLDIDGSDALDLGRYLYSDDAVPYRASPHERLLLNALNLVNFLAVGDLSGARVEARRFDVIESHFTDSSLGALHPELLALGNYLSGAVFEWSGEYERAVSRYAEAYRRGFREGNLAERIVALLRVTAKRPEELSDLVNRARDAGVLSPEDYRRTWGDGDVLVVVQTGLAPYKVPERLPIGLALTFIASVPDRYQLSRKDRDRLDWLMAQGLVMWLNFPSLTTVGIPGGGGATLTIDGAAIGSELEVRVDRQVEKSWESVQPVLIAAAVSRLITRTAVGYGAKEATEQIAKNQGTKKRDAETLGWLAALAIQAGLTAADTPDTRSWTMLPASIRIFRTRLGPGEHRVVATVAGAREEVPLSVAPGGWAALSFSRYR